VDQTRLDQLDRKIIKLLQYDGRMPFTQIAEKVDVSEGTVRRRVTQLIESGIMQIVGVVEPQYLGWGAAAMVGVSVEGGNIDSVAERIAGFPEVSYLFMASGEFDLFVEVYCRNREQFVSFLSNKLHGIPGIRQTRTFMILKMYKLSYRWGEASVPGAEETT
jgi:Lrp/AsnC family transcriptional regulator for asnA, asnC and gidA